MRPVSELRGSSPSLRKLKLLTDNSMNINFAPKYWIGILSAKRGAVTPKMHGISFCLHALPVDPYIAALENWFTPKTVAAPLELTPPRLLFVRVLCA